MHKNHDFTIVELVNDAQIMRAIRYLDPDFRVQGTGEDADTARGISITLATVLAGALTYIGLYVRTL